MANDTEVRVMQTIGRNIIWTQEKEITSANVVEVIRNAWPVFSMNRSECDFLLRYDRGEQPIRRKKTYRSDINIECIDNVANEITTFWTGMIYGNEITMVQRGESDSGKANREEQEAIARLNECYAAEFAKSKRAELADYVEICGHGYTYTDVNTDYADGDSYFKYTVLDPRFAFVVRSNAWVDHRVVLGVTFRQDDTGTMYFTAFSKDRRFEIFGGKIQNGPRNRKEEYEFFESERSGEINPLKMIPIVEHIRAHDRTGVWERQISDMDTLNIAESDLACLLDQNVQSIWHANDVDFPEEITKNADGSKTKKQITPKSNDWVMTYTTPDGKTPFITPLSTPCDYNGILNNITNKRALILQKCNVPSRNSTSGGSTGIAMSDASGWSQTEIEATKQQAIMEGAIMEEVRLALVCSKLSPDIPSDSPLLKLRYMDVKPSVKRQKSYELATKVNAFAVLVSHGIYGLHAINLINAFDDPQQVFEDSKELIERYQSSIFDKQTSVSVPERASADESDQVTNSPFIDGISTESPKGEEVEEDGNAQD